MWTNTVLSPSPVNHAEHLPSFCLIWTAGVLRCMWVFSFPHVNTMQTCAFSSAHAHVQTHGKCQWACCVLGWTGILFLLEGWSLRGARFFSKLVQIYLCSSIRYTLQLISQAPKNFNNDLIKIKTQQHWYQRIAWPEAKVLNWKLTSKRKDLSECNPSPQYIQIKCELMQI